MLLLHKELMILIINKVEICGVNTSKLPVIKEKRELLVKMRAGDENARETFIKGNLRLVLSVIQRFNNRGENVDDLFQVGCIGLMKAIDNFDLDQNVKFSTLFFLLIYIVFSFKGDTPQSTYLRGLKIVFGPFNSENQKFD